MTKYCNFWPIQASRTTVIRNLRVLTHQNEYIVQPAQLCTKNGVHLLRYADQKALDLVACMIVFFIKIISAPIFSNNPTWNCHITLGRQVVSTWVQIRIKRFFHIKLPQKSSKKSANGNLNILKIFGLKIYLSHYFTQNHHLAFETST